MENEANCRLDANEDVNAFASTQEIRSTRIRVPVPLEQLEAIRSRGGHADTRQQMPRQRMGNFIAGTSQISGTKNIAVFSFMLS